MKIDVPLGVVLVVVAIVALWLIVSALNLSPQGSALPLLDAGPAFFLDAHTRDRWDGSAVPPVKHSD